MKYLLVILFLSITATAFAQKQEMPLVQFSGITHNADSTQDIVPYVSIINNSYHKQVNISNYEGYFSFVVHEQDTIRFSSVGYAPVTIVIPTNIVHKSYTMQVMLKPQIINLPAFRVFPWATTEEFRKDFLTMKIADDDLEIAKKNLRIATSQAMEPNQPNDNTELNVNDMHNSIVNSHSITNPLLNPFAWGALIRQISDGDKKRQTSDSDAGYNF